VLALVSKYGKELGRGTERVEEAAQTLTTPLKRAITAMLSRLTPAA
jgi:hypothetical protein